MKLALQREPLTAIRQPWSGYYPEAKNSWLIVKEELKGKASSVFKNLTVKVTSIGSRQLVTAIAKYCLKKCIQLIKSLYDLTSSKMSYRSLLVGQCVPQKKEDYWLCLQNQVDQAYRYSMIYQISNMKNRNCQLKCYARR